jgi:hypothetical protein
LAGIGATERIAAIGDPDAGTGGAVVEHGAGARTRDQRDAYRDT